MPTHIFQFSNKVSTQWEGKKINNIKVVLMCKYYIRKFIAYLNGICLVFHLMGSILDKRFRQLNNGRTHLLFDPIFVQQIFLQHNHDRNACFAAHLRIKEISISERVKFYENVFYLIMNYGFTPPKILRFPPYELCNFQLKISVRTVV